MAKHKINNENAFHTKNKLLKFRKKKSVTKSSRKKNSVTEKFVNRNFLYTLRRETSLVWPIGGALTGAEGRVYASVVGLRGSSVAKIENKEKK